MLQPSREQGAPNRYWRLSACATAAFAILTSALPAPAHPALSNSIQHRLTLTVGPANTDIQVELTFNDARAMAQRHRMDSDRDWNVSPDERREYASTLATACADALGLAIDGRKVDLITLYEPEVDLLDLPQVGPCTCILRLYYFARTPVFIKTGSEIAVSNRLWPEAPAILSLSATGEGGFRIKAAIEDPFSPPAGPNGAYVLRARCERAVPVQGEPIGKAEPLNPPQAPELAHAGGLPGVRWWIVGLVTAVLAFSVRRYLSHRQA